MSIKKYIQSEGFETPNQLKMWKDHIEGLKIYNYPLQKNKEWNAVSNTFDIESWEEDWDDQETPEKIALKDKMYMKGALREDEQINEIFVVVKDKRDGKYDYLEMKGLSVDELLDKVKNNNNYEVVRFYKESSKAKNKVKALNSNNKQIDEQLENLIEISKEKLSGYIRKASKDVAQKGYELGSDGYDKKRAKKLGQRQHNIAKAADKLANEEFEQIDELSKDTLKSYLTKAKDDPERYMKAARASRETAQDYREKKRMGPAKYDIAKSYDDRAKKLTKKSMNRMSGKIKAAKKLANESLDPEAKLKDKISKMNVNQLKEVIKKLNDMHGDDEDTVFDYATRELEKKMPSKEFVKFMDQLDESVINEGSDKFNYLIKIDDVDPKFYEKPFGRQLEDMQKIKEFLKNAKKYTVGAKGKSTLAAVKKEIKERNPTQYYAKWRADSSNYKDDSVDLYYKDVKSINEAKNSNYPITQERAKEIIANTPFMSSYSKNMTDDEYKAVLDFWRKVSSKPNKGHLSFASVLGMIAKGKKIED